MLVVVVTRAGGDKVTIPVNDADRRAMRAASVGEDLVSIVVVGVLNLEHCRSVCIDVEATLLPHLTLFCDGEVEPDCCLALTLEFSCVLLRNGEVLAVSVVGDEFCQCQVVRLGKEAL
jgi:hypothetical protein